jgi:hypothetical protein
MHPTLRVQVGRTARVRVLPMAATVNKDNMNNHTPEALAATCEDRTKRSTSRQ